MRSASGWLAAGTSASPAVAGSLENRLIGPLSLNRLTGKRKCGDAWEKQLSMVSFKWLVKTRKAKTRSPTSACGRVAATYGKRKDARLRSGPLQGLGVALAGGFVEDDRGGSGGVEGLNATGHWNADAGVGAALGFSGKAGAFVADEERDGLTPVDLPGGQQRLATLFGGSHAGRQRADAADFELREENREGHSGEDGEMKGRARRGAQRFRRIRAGCAADSERGGRSQDRSNVARVLHAREDHEKRRARGTSAVHEVVERGLARFHQSGDALRMLGVGEALEEAVGRAQRRESYLRAVDQRGETSVMAVAGFAEEHRLNGAAGTQGFFDETDAFDANEAAFVRQAATERHAKLLEPAIVAAGEEGAFASGARIARGFTRRSHSLEVSKFRACGAKISCKCQTLCRHANDRT